MSINHPLPNITFACAEPSLDYFQHLKLHAHVFVVFVLSPSPQCQNIGLGGGGGASIYIYILDYLLTVSGFRHGPNLCHLYMTTLGKFHFCSGNPIAKTPWNTSISIKLLSNFFGAGLIHVGKCCYRYNWFH